MDFLDDDFELEDFALIGGVIGAVEEELEEERKEKKLEDKPWDRDQEDFEGGFTEDSFENWKENF